MVPAKPFWEVKSLDEMSDEEWESLCDGCGRCCMNKLEDEDTGDVLFTRVSCKLLDTETCRCTNYGDRFTHVPDCLTIKPLDEQKLSWLPDTCAYRLLSENKSLENWHPLISGSSDSVQEAGISMAHLCLNENYVPIEDFFRHVIELENGDTD